MLLADDRDVHLSEGRDEVAFDHRPVLRQRQLTGTGVGACDEPRRVRRPLPAREATAVRATRPGDLPLALARVCHEEAGADGQGRGRDPRSRRLATSPPDAPFTAAGIKCGITPALDLGILPVRAGQKRKSECPRGDLQHTHMLRGALISRRVSGPAVGAVQVREHRLSSRLVVSRRPAGRRSVGWSTHPHRISPSRRHRGNLLGQLTLMRTRDRFSIWPYGELASPSRLAATRTTAK